eukprot:1161967-Pelagomonas_calceolata.AAC.9
MPGLQRASKGRKARKKQSELTWARVSCWATACFRLAHKSHQTQHSTSYMELIGCGLASAAVPQPLTDKNHQNPHPTSSAKLS